MKKLASFLTLLIYTSGVSSSSLCGDKVRDLFGLTGAAVTEIPYISTILNLVNSIVGLGCGGNDLEEVIRDIAITEDRKQEAINCASRLKSHIQTINEIRSYNDLKQTTYNNLRIAIQNDRFWCFDATEHHHASKFQLFTEYASIELALIDMMINSGQPNKRVLEEAYGNALLFYIKKGGEMAIKLALQYEDNSSWTALHEVNRLYVKYLRSPLIQWMDHVETKREVRKRLLHTGLEGEEPSSEKSQWIDWLGYNQARYLPLKIHDGNWIALKTLKPKWLSCWNSIHGEAYCHENAGCLGVDGGQAASSCPSEKFQIQTTSHGPIKLSYGNRNDKIAFYYDRHDSKRGGGNFWLSAYYRPKIYTMRCIGTSFTQEDISRCDKEVFAIKVAVNGGVVEHKEQKNLIQHLRNGDYITIYWSGIFPLTQGFLLQQYRNGV